MKKITYLVASLLLMGTTPLLTGCVDIDEPAGIEELRGAKAELLTAKAAVEKAKVATEEANAAYRNAEAEYVKAQAAREKAEAAIKEAEADKLKAETETEWLNAEIAKAKAEQELQRYTALVADGAANRKLQDDAQSQVAVLRRQLEAQLSSLRTSTSSLDAQMGTADVQQLQVADQLLKCHVASPIDGVVLEKYVEQGEFASIGKPLFKVADTHKMYLRAYVTTAQLAKVAVGKQVKVFADYGNGNRKEYKGSVCWISQKAEFTPKTVLTDDERADLVYAVKVFVENDGGIKMGMYGEVAF